MSVFILAWEALQAFFERGGDVLIGIFVVTLLMWILIFERLWYYRLDYPNQRRELQKQWADRNERSSWEAQQIKRLTVAQMGLNLERSVTMIKTLVAICPLLGLLGTVSGMIEVFDIMAVAGTGNPRAMASGVSRATIPTMAGMVAALSGMYFTVRFSRVVHKEKQRFERLLSID